MTPSASERRRARRFALHLPVRVVKLRQKAVEILSETRDVSSVGAFFNLANQDLPAGAPIEFFVTLESAPDQSVELRCRGRVVRVEAADGESSVGIGASIDRYQFIRP